MSLNKTRTEYGKDSDMLTRLIIEPWGLWEGRCCQTAQRTDQVIHILCTCVWVCVRALPNERRKTHLHWAPIRISFFCNYLQEFTSLSQQPPRRDLLLCAFLDEETERPRNWVICPNPHSSEVLGLGFRLPMAWLHSPRFLSHTGTTHLVFQQVLA